MAYVKLFLKKVNNPTFELIKYGNKGMTTQCCSIRTRSEGLLMFI